MEKILIVEDDYIARKAITHHLHGKYEYFEASNSIEAIKLAETTKFDFVLLDIWLGKGPNGLETLEKLKLIDDSLEVIITTLDDSTYLIEKCIKFGVLHYLKKPVRKDDLFISLEILKKITQLKKENEMNCALAQNNQKQAKKFFPNSASPKMKEVLKAIEKIKSFHDLNILILGENGTGKEYVAKELHNKFPKKPRKFVSVNCAAIPSNLFESELFGYDKGAFSGAINTKPGLLELANNGDLFLDEIGELPLEIQSKFLRVLEEKEFMHLGGKTTIKSNFRLICATNRDLDSMVKKNLFREDLFYRINGYRILIPPLRERTEDLEMICNFFLTEINSKLDKDINGINTETFTEFKKWNWNGNIRELKTVLTSMAINSDNKTLALKHLETYSQKKDEPQTINLNSDLLSRVITEGYKNFFDNLENSILLQVLKSEETLDVTSKKLNLKLTTLHSKLKKYNLLKNKDLKKYD